MSKRQPKAKTPAAPAVEVTDSAVTLDLAQHVAPPYFGTAEHEDTTRLLVPIASLTRDPTNARLHDERNIRQIRASLRRRGQQTPINVDRNGRVLKGNGTIESAEQEGWGYVWVVVSQLEGAEADGYAIADNATGVSSKWDFEKLAGNIKNINTAFAGSGLEFTADDFGLDDYEIDPLLAAEWQPGAFTGEGNDPSSDPKAQPKVGDVVAPNGTGTLEREGAPRETRPSDLDADDRADNAKSIPVTPNMRVTIEMAVERVRLVSGDLSMSEGKCLELIAADYLAGAPSREDSLNEYERITQRTLTETREVEQSPEEEN